MKKKRYHYYFLIFLFALLVVNSVRTEDSIVTSLSLVGIILTLLQLRDKEDIKLVITKKAIYRKFKNSNINDYFVIFLELTNLSTYSQFFDIQLSDQLIHEIYHYLKKILGNNVFLYSGNQIIIVSEFDNKVVINQKLRVDEQFQRTKRILNYLHSKKYIMKNTDEYYQVKITAGAGSVGIRENDVTVNNIIKLAHFAMITAKKENVDVHVATETTRIIKDDLDMFNQEIESGLKYDEFVPYFSPIIDPSTMKIVGCESFLRWEKSEYRIIEAAKFKDIAVEKNLFDKIDLRIIKKSFESYNTWRKKELVDERFRITINLSLQSLLSISLHQLISLAERHGINRDCIDFDITESDLSNPHALSAINKLKEAQFRVSIDAFDSNTTVLKSLFDIKVDTLKLSRNNLPENLEKTEEIRFYESLIDFSRFLGYNIMSKGIENKKQLQLARELNVEFVQGYYFTPPLNDTSILGFLNKYQNGILA